MPSYFQQSNPWEGAAGVGGQAASGIARLATELPRARAEAQMMMQQRQLLQTKLGQVPAQEDLLRARTGEAKSHGNLFDSQASLATAKAGSETMRTDGMSTLAEGLQGIMTSSQSGKPMDPENIAKFTKGLSTLPAKDQATYLQKVIGIMSSQVGTNPTVGRAVVTGAKIPPMMNVPQGGTAVDPMTGQVMATGAANIAPGGVRLAPSQGGEAQSLAGVSPYAPRTTDPNAASRAAITSGLVKGDINATNVPSIVGTINQAFPQVRPQAQPIEQAPMDTTTRIPGKQYLTPKGPMIWTGQGWSPVGQ